MQSQQKSHFVYVLFLIVALLFSGCAAPIAAPAAQESAAAAPASAGGESAARPAAEESVRPASEPALSAPATDAESAPSSHRGPTPAPDNRRPQNEPVTAGVVDDNEQWNDYLDYRARHDYLWVNERDISERIAVQVWDANNEPVHDATVEIFGDQQQTIFGGRTDAGGRLFFHPRALNVSPRTQTFFVTASKGYVAQRQQFSHVSIPDSFGCHTRCDDLQIAKAIQGIPKLRASSGNGTQLGMVRRFRPRGFPKSTLRNLPRQAA